MGEDNGKRPGPRAHAQPAGKAGGLEEAKIGEKSEIKVRVTFNSALVTNGKLDPVQIDWVDLEQSFETYVMYKPTGVNSRWVALDSVAWKIRSRAKAQIVGPNNGKWIGMPPGWGTSWDLIPSFGAATAQPEWNHQYGLGQDLM